MCGRIAEARVWRNSPADVPRASLHFKNPSSAARVQRFVMPCFSLDLWSRIAAWLAIWQLQTFCEQLGPLNQDLRWVAPQPQARCVATRPTSRFRVAGIARAELLARYSKNTPAWSGVCTVINCLPPAGPSLYGSNARGNHHQSMDVACHPEKSRPTKKSARRSSGAGCRHPVLTGRDRMGRRVKRAGLAQERRLLADSL